MTTATQKLEMNIKGGCQTANVRNKEVKKA
jgi:hypothetical protein